jgi:adenosylcobinamide kinase/adenosylcobinamide-phosphate guanylyltransferase
MFRLGKAAKVDDPEPGNLPEAGVPSRNAATTILGGRNRCPVKRRSSSSSIVLVLGGARSGKSAYAEARALALGRGRALYLATAEAGDREMRARIDAHRARRGGAWTTIEEPLALATAIDAHAKPGAPILVDCLTLWLANLLHARADIGAETARLCVSLAKAKGPVVLVSNEVGLGIVPDNALAREFRDHAGRLHQAVARVARDVVFVAAGLPLALKGKTK